MTKNENEKKKYLKDLIKNSSNCLIGKCFHTLVNCYDSVKDECCEHCETRDMKRIWRQGIIIGNPESNYYLVEYFSWIDGNPATQEIVKFCDMNDWFFYDDDERMKHSYKYGIARSYRRDSFDCNPDRKY